MIEKDKRPRFEELLKEMKQLFPDTTIRVKLIITNSETKLVTDHRYPDELESRKISMKNIKGEWIK